MAKKPLRTQKKATVVTVSKLKKRLWKVFSEYIRRKESYNDYCTCITCGKKFHWKEIQAGHYIHGNTKRTYFYEDNVHPQCVRCNMYLSGDLTNYAIYLENRYGKGAGRSAKRG